MWGAGCRRPGEAAGTPRGRAGRRIVARDGRVIVGARSSRVRRSRARRRALAHCSRGTAAGLPVRFDFSRDAPFRVSAGPGGRVYAHPRSTARLRVEEGMRERRRRSLALRRRARGPKPRWCAGTNNDHVPPKVTHPSCARARGRDGRVGEVSILRRRGGGVSHFGQNFVRGLRLAHALGRGAHERVETGYAHFAANFGASARKSRSDFDRRASARDCDLRRSARGRKGKN